MKVIPIDINIFIALYLTMKSVSFITVRYMSWILDVSEVYLVMFVKTYVFHNGTNSPFPISSFIIGSLTRATR